jgi:catechol 2,3-dioxygenase-like lactoylglutathione lyase family enzyme
VPHIGLVTLVVRDYDEAIAFYVGVLGFRIVEDRPIDETKRWVVVAPPGDHGTSLLLARTATSKQNERVGDQTGGRVSFFLYTDDFESDHDRLAAAGVTFIEAPRSEPYGTVAVFKDLYGNRWDLIESRAQPPRVKRMRR